MNRNSLRYFSFLAILILLVATLPLTAFASSTATACDNTIEITSTSSEYDVSVSGTTATAKAEGGLIGRETITVTVKNASDATAEISFTWGVSGNYASFTDPNGGSSSSGNYSATLAANGTVTMTLKGKASYGAGAATLTLSNLSYTAAADSSKVTVNYDSSYGTVVAGSTTISNGGFVEANATDGITLTATGANGGTFLGWVNPHTNELLSTAAAYTLYPAQDTTVMAAFAASGSNAWFYVGGGTTKQQSYGLLGLSKFNYYTVTGYTHLCDTLSAAVTAAQNSTSKYIIPANSGTLPAGDYTIPSGVTLVIPFDSSNTTYTENGQWTGDKSTYSTPTAYRTLTMASGANLTVNGAMSVSGKYTYAAGGTALAVSGPVGMVNMNSGSTITVNGSLYAYGFIYGTGAVTVSSTGSVHEMMQLGDCRGGTQTTGMENGVLPFSQYWVQNIEVSTTYHGGAKLRANLVMYMSSTVFVTGVDIVTDVDSVGLFKPHAGSTLIKKYDGSKDRTYVEIDGDATIDSFTISVNGITIDTAEYVFPQTSSWEFSFKSGTTTIKQDLAFIPGAVNNIGKNATIKLASGISVYFYDADQWGTYCYSSEAGADVTMLSVKYSPTKTYTRTAADLVDSVGVCAGVFDATEGGLYSTAGGAGLVGEESGIVKITEGTETVTYQFRQTASTYDEIPINPAWLKNADESYVHSGTNTYTYTDGYWRCETHTDAEPADHICDVCGLNPCSNCEDTNPVDGDCDVCGKTLCEHDGEKSATAATAATCVADGHKAYWTCGTCGKHFSDEACTTEITDLEAWLADETETGGKLAASGHTYGEEVTYTWTGYTACVATRTCTVCTEETEGHSETASAASITSEETKAATCKETGVKTYTATFDMDWAEQQTETEEIEINPDAHDWDNACDTTCNNGCGETRTTEHNYSSEVTTAATCEKDGVRTYTCSVCKDSYTEAISATGHSYGEPVFAWNAGVDSASCTATFTCTVCTDEENRVVTGTCAVTEKSRTAATCGEDGSVTYTATITFNNKTYTNDSDAVKIPATGAHVYVAGEYTWSADNKSCTVVGDCSGCDATATATATVESKVKSEATCEAKGTTTYTATFAETWATTQTKDVDDIAAKGHTPGAAADCENAQTCTVCKVELAAKLGHDYKAVVTAPTCTEDGYTIYTCGTCGDSYKADTVVALGHSYNSVITAPTCTEDGYTTHTCTVCGDTHTDSATDALGHAYDDGVVTTEPTCEGKGEKKFTCSTCGDIKAEEIAATGHDYEAVVTPSTCGEKGYTTYTCKNDSEHTYVADEVAALGHTEGEVVVENKVAPNCENDGSYDNVVYCTVCKVEVSRNTVVVPATGHTKGEVQRENNVDPTCTADGSYDNVVYCTVCEVEVSRDNVVVAALGHDEVNHDAKEPTCSEIGWDVYVTCNKCDYSTYEEKAATGHTYTSVVTAPNCTEQGYTTHTCSKCGDTYTDSTVPATGHVDTETKTVQNDDGKTHTTTVTCSCGVEVSTDTANCEDTNNDFECDACGGLLVNAYTDAVTMAEEYEGTNSVDDTTVTLKYAGKIKYLKAAGTGAWNHWVGFKITAPAGVSLNNIKILRPDDQIRVMANIKDGDNYAYLYWGMTEDEDKLAEYKIDWNGDGTYDLNVVLDATNATLLECEHAWGDGVVTTEPTCTEEGVKTYTCANCGDSYTEAVDALGHDEQTAYAPIAGEHKHTATVTCDTCSQQIGEVTTEDCTDTDKNNACDKCEAVLGKEVTFTNKTSATAGAVIKIGGEVVASNSGVLGADGMFTVTHDKACVVIVAIDNGDGTKTYHKLTAGAAVGENTYPFSINEVPATVDESAGAMEIVVAVKGDINGDGNADMTDAMQIVYSRVSDTMQAYQPLNDFQTTMGDLSRDGNADMTDAMQIIYSRVSNTIQAYSPIEWDVMH